MLFLMKLLFRFCLDFCLPKNLDNTGEQFGNYQKKYGNTALMLETRKLGVGLREQLL